MENALRKTRLAAWTVARTKNGAESKMKAKASLFCCCQCFREVGEQKKNRKSNPFQ
jgi:hypothetical protein